MASSYSALRAHRRRQIEAAAVEEEPVGEFLLEDAQPDPEPAREPPRVQAADEIASSTTPPLAAPYGIPAGIGQMLDRRTVLVGGPVAAAAAALPGSSPGPGGQSGGSVDPVRLAAEEIRLYEGWRGQPVLFAYDDKATTRNGPVPLQPGDKVKGRVTIGWGRAYGVKPGDRVTPEEADAMLREDVGSAMAAVDRLEAQCVKRGHPYFAPEVAAALCSFSYNLGAQGFANTRSVAGRMRAGDYMGAANGLTLYIYSDGELMTGLVNRREREKRMMLDGLLRAPDGTQVAMDARATPSHPEKPLAKSSTLGVSAGGVMSSVSTFIASVTGVAPQYQGVLLLVSFVILIGVIAYNCSERVRKFLTGEGW